MGLINGINRSGQNIFTALVQINANKGRSFLTTLGIIIAVTSTITVISLVQGFGNYMTDMMRGYGTQYLVVRPYNPSNMRRAGMGRITMDMADVRAVHEECSEVHRISPFIYTENAELTYGVEVAKDVPVRGVSEYYQIIRNFYTDAGRFFGPIDVENASKVVLLGRTVLKKLGCDESIVGEYIHMNNRRYLVIGILESKGSLMGNDQDNTAIIPYTTALNLFPQNRYQVPFLAEARNEDEVDHAVAQITRVLRRRHRLQHGQPNDFRIERQDQTLSEFLKIRNIASGILAGIVSISLLVGGIGIMNMMLVSVTERTGEIGLRKAIGGRRRDILLQFLTEAIVLCTIGGLMGVFFGYSITKIASLHPSMVDISVPMWSVILALGFSAGTGLLFGMIPAFKAALLHPIDALRHE